MSVITQSTPSLEKTDQQQNLPLMKIYSLYRTVLCIALLLTFFLDPYERPLVGELKPDLLVYSVCGYLLFNLVTLIIILPKRILWNSRQLFANFVIDIFALILILDSSGGINSGVGILMVVVVASSSIMLRGQLAILIAALASLSILADTASLISQQHLNFSSFLSAGLLGTTLFITAFLIQNLAFRIRGAQLIAEQKTDDVSKLQLLNQQIVERMRTGIIVTDQHGKVYMANMAAGELLGNPTLQNAFNQSPLPTLHPKLMAQLRQWLQYPRFQTPAFRATETGPELHASFSAISNDERTDILVFLEDNRRLAQQAQQIKLASLGRLTASIAHEIRNPLGAISHASQLLQESDTLANADQRLCEIIKNHSGRVNKVIENVLQLSSRSAPNPETVSLQHWLRQFVSEFNAVDHPDADIAIEVVQDCEVTIDLSQLNQVVTNLVHNGLRYSLKATNKAHVTLKVQLNAMTQLPVLDIIDDGIGVTDDAKDQLFEPFYTTETKGSGLGLYISRELCQANEARLDYIRTEAGKSCFRLSFAHSDRRLLPD